MRVMLATDGSADARAAADWLAGAPLPAATEVLVASVATLPPSPIDIPHVRQLYEALLEEATGVAAEAKARLRARWPGATTRAVQGEPRETLVRLATEWRADLLVVGARGLGAVASFVLGSVSTAMVRHAPCPVFVVKGTARPLRRAVLAVDGSPDSLAAARAFTRLFGGGVAVRLVGVTEPPRFPSTAPLAIRGVLKAAVDMAVEEARRELGKALDHAEAELGAADVERALPVGRPAEEILIAAGAPDVDAVVLGARGLGMVGRAVLGSVSERVLREARRSVLVVKPTVEKG